MARRKLPVRAGDWFAVPLDTGGYAVGKLAAADGHGGAVGYFFGPAHPHVPTAEDIGALERHATALTLRFGDRALLDGRWQMIARPEEWAPEEWPFSPLAMVDAYTGDAWHVEYSSSDLLRPVCRTHVMARDVIGLPSDFLSLYAGVERVLTALLSGDAGSSPPPRPRPYVAWPGRWDPRRRVWGPGFFSDDVSLDVVVLFEGSLAAGASAEDAAEYVLLRMAADLEDEDDGALVWVTLAILLIRWHVRHHRVFARAQQVIRAGQGLGRWSGCHPLALQQRESEIHGLDGAIALWIGQAEATTLKEEAGNVKLGTGSV